MDALEYAEKHGWRVFPCIAGEKIPATAHGFKDATTEPSQLDTWFAKGDHNVGIATGNGLFVLDVDRKEGRPDGMDSLQVLQEQHEPLPVTASVITPSGGRHYYFAVDREYKNSASKIGPSLDVRCDGGYVVAPPSVVDGRLYQWVPTCTPEEVGVARLPDWLAGLAVEKEKEPEQAVQRSDGLIYEGARNDALTSLAGWMRQRNMHPNAIRSALHAENVSRCQPSLDAAEVDKIVDSILRYAPGVAMHATLFNGDTPEPETVDPGKLPEDLLLVPGFIGDVIEWNLRTARRKQPALALGAAIALLASLTGRKVADTHNTRTNLYIIGIAPSGMGKDHARTINKTILYQCGRPDLMGPEDFASSTGLVNALNHRPCQLFQVDEFGKILSAINNPRAGSHLSGITTELLKLYSSSNSIYLGKAFADRKQNVEINQPHAVLYGTTVAESFYAGLTSEGLTDGFYGRLLAFQGEIEDLDVDPEPIHAAPEDIIETAKFWAQAQPGGNLSNNNPQPLVVEYTAEAKEAQIAFAKICEERLRSTAEGSSAIWGRASEKATKLALLYACSSCPTQPVIAREAIEWATGLIEHQTQWMLHVAGEYVTSNEIEAALKKVKRIIGASGSKGLTRNELTRKTQWLKARHRQEILMDLMESGEVVEDSKTTATNKAVVYKAR